MSGLFTAAFLRQVGWQAEVYERSSVELVGRGAGITTHPELLAALEASGAGTKNLGVIVDKRIALDRKGNVIAEKPLTQILTSWDRLQRLLRETIQPAHYHLGHEFERVEQRGDGVRVNFSNGRVEHADILVGGDGARSSVRAQIMPEVQPIYAGYYIWRGTAHEADLSRRALKDVFPYFSFFLPHSKKSSAIRFPDLTMTSGRVIGASISSGIASQTHSSSQICALTKLGISTDSQCHHRSFARI